AGGDERLVEHERRLGEARVDIAVGPLLHGPAGRKLILADGGEVLRGPLEARDLAAVDDVAVRAGIRAARIQALERIDRERQLLVVDANPLERIRRELLALRGDREDRLADEEGLVRQDLVLRR